MAGRGMAGRRGVGRGVADVSRMANVSGVPEMAQVAHVAHVADVAGRGGMAKVQHVAVTQAAEHGDQQEGPGEDDTAKKDEGQRIGGNHVHHLHGGVQQPIVVADV